MIKTLADNKPIQQVDGWMVMHVRLTAAGRKKVEDAFDYYYYGGQAIDLDGASWNDPDFEDKYFIEPPMTVKGCISDIESEAAGSDQHPYCMIEGEEINFVENIDYVIEMQSEEAFRLGRLAESLMSMHQTMDAELNRMGW